LGFGGFEVLGFGIGAWGFGFRVSGVPTNRVSRFGLTNKSGFEMWSGSEAGSYTRLIDLCITQL